MPAETIIALLAALGLGSVLVTFLQRHFEQQKRTSSLSIML